MQRTDDYLASTRFYRLPCPETNKMVLTIEFGQSCLDNGVMSATSTVPAGKDGGLN